MTYLTMLTSRKKLKVVTLASRMQIINLLQEIIPVYNIHQRSYIDHCLLEYVTRGLVWDGLLYLLIDFIDSEVQSVYILSSNPVGNCTGSQLSP